MLKKLVLLVALALSAAATYSTVSASEPFPTPDCLPCD
jgi:hypothetical protein